jgi:membrane protease YdiL (CAAX protease family)
VIVGAMTEPTAPERPIHPRSSFVERPPFTAFVGLAYAISWTLWAIAIAGGGDVPFLLGALGPAAAAALVTWLTGGSLRAWISPAWRWRVPIGWWGYALGLPALLYASVSLVLQLLGEPVDWRLALERAPAYAATFLFVLVLGGAMEEPGWRGFGLPALQRRRSPLAATLILGLVWGVWHVPVYGPLGFIVPAVLAFFYTYLWNRTGSVLLCILLHASFTPAQDHLILMARDRAYSMALDVPDLVILGVYLGAAALLVLLTRGRLGAGARLPEPAEPLAGQGPGMATVSRGA